MADPENPPEIRSRNSFSRNVLGCRPSSELAIGFSKLVANSLSGHSRMSVLSVIPDFEPCSFLLHARKQFPSAGSRGHLFFGDGKRTRPARLFSRDRRAVGP